MPARCYKGPPFGQQVYPKEEAVYPPYCGISYDQPILPTVAGANTATALDYGGESFSTMLVEALGGPPKNGVPEAPIPCAGSGVSSVTPWDAGRFVGAK